MSLNRAVSEVGQQWEKVSTFVGRMSSDCRDRYRNHIANREVRITGLSFPRLYHADLGADLYPLGHWTRQEEEELTEIVTAMTIKQGKDFDNDVFWGKVSEQMGNRRGRQQCRIKWYMGFGLCSIELPVDKLLSL
jgi:Myb-like DNA-binding domain